MDILIGRSSSRQLVTARLRIDQRWLDLALPLGIFLAVLLPRILGLNVFLTADEDDQIMFASLFLKAALQGNWAGALVLGYPGVPTLILGALGVGLRYLFHYQGWLPLPWVTADLMSTLNQVTTTFGVFDYPMDFLVWVRLPMAVTASVSITGIYLLVSRLLDKRLALLGTLIIAFDPFILAHTRIIHVDAPLSYFMFLSFLAFLLYVARGGWKWLLLSGLCGGLAALSKTPAALLGPILVVSGTLYALLPPAGTPRSVRWKRLGLALLGWGVVAVGAFFALWPAMWTRPGYALQWILSNIRSVNRSYHPTTGIFWQTQQSDQNPFYYLIAFPFHLTPLTTLGVIGGLILIVAGFVAYWRYRRADPRTPDEQGLTAWVATNLPLAMSLVVYIVVFVAPVSLISRRGDRYILPVFFAVGLLSALTLWWLARLVLNRFSGLTGRVTLTPTRLAGLVVLLQAFFVLLYHPYYLAYYNPLLGGGRTAPYYVNIGWGEGLDLAARYLNDLAHSDHQAESNEPVQVAAWYSSQFAPFYHGQTIDLSNESAALTGDYAVFYINQVQRGFPSGEILDYFRQREPLHVIKLGGIPYAWIYPGPVIDQEPPQNYAFPVGMLLGGGALLVGVDVPRFEMPVDAYMLPPEIQEPVVYGEDVGGLPVTLYWKTVAQINGEHNVYIRLVDDEGNSWGQIDRLILSGIWRPDRWYNGYYLRDEYRLPIDPATPPGNYHLEVGMYDFVTGQSYGVVRDIGQITLTPPERLVRLEDLKRVEPVSTPINESLVLVGHDYTPATIPVGGEVVGKIFWQATQKLAKDYRLEFSFISNSEHKKYIIAEIPLAGPTFPPSQWRRSEIVGTAYRFHIPAFAPAGVYPFQVTVIDPDNNESIGPAVTLTELTLEVHERNFELPAGVTPVSAVINDEIELVGYRLLDETVAPKKTFGLNLYWRSLQPARSNYTVFVHAIGPDQIMRGQWDSMPVQGTSPTSGWLPGEIIEDHYDVLMAKDAPPWKYDLFVGMYDALTGQRLPVVGHTVPVSDNRVWLTRVQVVPNNED